MTKNQILVQNIETFDKITHLTVDVESGETATERIDQYFSNNDKWGIVSLDEDADGEYMYVMLVAPIDGPDYDVVTNEPVETAAAELEAKLDIAMEIDMEETITRLCDGPAAAMGIIKEVKIVDQNDLICVHIKGRNIVFPVQLGIQQRAFRKAQKNQK